MANITLSSRTNGSSLEVEDFAPAVFANIREINEVSQAQLIVLRTLDCLLITLLSFSKYIPITL